VYFNCKELYRWFLKDELRRPYFISCNEKMTVLPDKLCRSVCTVRDRPLMAVS